MRRIGLEGAGQKDTPISRPVSALGSIVSVAQVGGLHHRYDRRVA
jgi:hypothetical protein